jgi:hypothetical protein
LRFGLGAYKGARREYHALPDDDKCDRFCCGGTYSKGVFSVFSGPAKINHSVIKGSIFTKDNGFGVTSFVRNTQLDGKAGVNQGAIYCGGVYDENYTFYSNTSP